MAFKEGEGLIDRHVQDIRDIFVLVENLQDFRPKSFPFAGLTGDDDILQKLHVEHLKSGSLAGLTAASLGVEGEVAWFEAVPLGFPGAGKEIPDLTEDLDIGGRVGPEALSDGRLVDEDEVVDLFKALDGVKGSFFKFGIPVAFRAGIENVLDQRGLPCAGDTRDADHHAQRNPDIDPFQVVFPCIPDRDPSLWFCRGVFRIARASRFSESGL